MSRGLTYAIGRSLELGDEQQSATFIKPRRFCAMYFGFGVGLPQENSDQAAWRWFPKGEGRDYQFAETLKPLDAHREKLTVLQGLSHPNGRRMGGHDTGDTFLTGAFLNNKFLVNTISVDQLAHDWDKPGGAEKLGQWDRFMAEQLAYFLDRLESAQEDNGSLLDNSVVLYGSSNSVTHDNNNYPLVLAGGAAMGLKHGRCLKLSDTVPKSNLFVTLLNCLGDSSPSFADSTGTIPELTS